MALSPPGHPSTYRPSPQLFLLLRQKVHKEPLCRHPKVRTCTLCQALYQAFACDSVGFFNVVHKAGLLATMHINTFASRLLVCRTPGSSALCCQR